MVAIPAFVFYESLTCLAACRAAPAAHREELLRRVRTNQDALDEWARHAPMNHRHKWQLVEAELARVTGQGGAAREYYDLAIKGAREHRYIQEEALAHELASQFYSERDQKPFAELYLQDAHSAYLQWGAVAKARQLQERSAKLVERTAGAPLANVDAMTLIRVSQTLSKETDLDRLLDRLLRLLIEHAGATKGALIQHEAGALTVRALVEGLGRVRIFEGLALEECTELPRSLVNLAARTRQRSLWNDVPSETSLASDAYIREVEPKSLACIPVEHQGTLQFVLFLENGLTTNAFALPQIELINVLANQAAISFANARFFEQLRQKTEELDQFFRLTPDLLSISDLEGRFRLLNPDWESTLGYAREELLERRFFEFVHPEDLAATQEAMKRLADRQNVLDFVNRYRCKDGSYRWLEWRAAPAGKLVFAAARDITRRVHAEQELKAAKESAEAAGRIKSEFLDIAAHELRTPLSATSLLVQLSQLQIQRGAPISPATFDKLGRQLARLQGLVDDLLDVSRLERGVLVLKRARLDLPALVRETLEEFRLQNPGRSIELMPPPSPVFVEADAMRLQQVLGNLIENALKYTPDGSPIEVSVALGTEGVARVEVRDRGPGIPRELQGALFTRFFRASSNETIRHPGLGLGLFICRNLIELHGGRMDFVSEPGKGSTFFFELPAARDKAGEP